MRKRGQENRRKGGQENMRTKEKEGRRAGGLKDSVTGGQDLHQSMYKEQ
jgi:hypothetical protein